MEMLTLLQKVYSLLMVTITSLLDQVGKDIFGTHLIPTPLPSAHKSHVSMHLPNCVLLIFIQELEIFPQPLPILLLVPPQVICKFGP